jgi:dimeric dUTPase (all-alpha-NTP-PPase superfamily)
MFTEAQLLVFKNILNDLKSFKSDERMQTLFGHHIQFEKWLK